MPSRVLHYQLGIDTRGGGLKCDARTRTALKRAVANIANERRLKDHEIVRAIGDEAEWSMFQSGQLNRSSVLDLIVGSVISEGDNLRTRALLDNPGLFARVDQLEAEADFRRALGPALWALAVVLAFRASWWAVVPPLVLGGLLMLQGAQRRYQASASLVDALPRLGSPTLDYLKGEGPDTGSA
jgi:hypothetical protein